MRDFAGKVAFITGGASGAGFGQAKVFAGAGCKVVIADIRRDHLEAAGEYFKARNNPVLTIQLDITDRRAYAEAADEVEKVFGCPPQLLFNTAGVNTFGPVEASTFEDFDWVMGVDLGGVINGMVTFVPRMIKAGLGGHIITTSSMAAFSAAPDCAPYSTAKAAVNSLMESYYLALQPYNIGVTCFCPGGIKSNIAEATFTRPAHLANTGYHVNAKTIQFERRLYAAMGMDPVELAMLVKKGIENEQFLVIPFPDPEAMLRDNFNRIIDYSSASGTLRRAELRKHQAGNIPIDGAVEVGWGQARPDIGWVKNPG